MFPLEPHHMDPMVYGEQASWIAPLVGGFVTMLMLLALVAGWQAWRRRDQLGALLRGARSRGAMSAEHRAREILAERFARGEIDSQEFMERSSMLNWTPGVEPQSPGKKA
ncbi:MAG TPA: hypothetical protein VHO26_03060 [Propionibacteriaceae bacterium]|nr:hypothetical protein [Propionibacteriaceae bacterium]